MNKDKFIIKTGDEGLSFDLYPELQEEVILDALISEYVRYSLPIEVLEMLVESWNSRFWVTKGYDGATLIKNKKHPAICNFFHDYMWRCGMGGIQSDIIYKRLLVMTGYSKRTASFRYRFIRIGWLTIFKRRHIMNNNVKKHSLGLIRLYKRIA